MIVVDATVVCYYIMPGDQTDAVLRLREWDAEWSAPELWKSEVLNVLSTYLRRGELRLDLALQHFETATMLVGATVYEPSPLEILPLTVESGRSAYDCQYVALAKRLGARLATNDRALQKAFPDIAKSPQALTSE